MAKPVVVSWEYQDSYGIWHVFGPVWSAAIEDVFASKYSEGGQAKISVENHVGAHFPDSLLWNAGATPEDAAKTARFFCERAGKDFPARRVVRSVEETVLWEWEEGRDWWFYDLEVAQKIEEAFRDKKDKVTTNAAYSYTIDLKNMLQRNDTTSKERKIRRTDCPASVVVAGETTPLPSIVSVWEFQDTPTEWKPYDVSSCGKLDDAVKAQEDKVQLTLGQWAYTVDLENKQQINEATKKRRSIRHVYRTLQLLNPVSTGRVRCPAALKASTHHRGRRGRGHHRHHGSPTKSPQAMPRTTAKGVVQREIKLFEEVVRDGDGQVAVEPLPVVVVAKSDLKDPNDNCAVCREALFDDSDPKEVVRLNRCPVSHALHMECLKGWWKEQKTCIHCKAIYGRRLGKMPPGTMVAHLDSKFVLPGNEPGTIMIEYVFPEGVQGPGHPNPGVKYASDSRRAFLPDTIEGRRVLQLMRRSFRQRLMFRIDRSVVRQRDNVIVWNDVHHKTKTHGGPSHFGYPDPEYLQRVSSELAAKGISWDGKDDDDQDGKPDDVAPDKVPQDKA